jgi:DNA/RNA endonuclease G (NUC1)
MSSLRRRLVLVALAALQLAGVARATIGTALQSQLGNPSGATAVATATTNYLIPRDQYTLGYNSVTREPNWVSWNLTTVDTGSSGRSSNFFQDTTLPAGFYQVLTTDYSGSGFDRGHMCPSGDRTTTAADNEVTFFMSNMIPQSPDNNQGVWANFESECRTLAAAGNEILITSGPSGFSGTTIASGVAVAGFTWKIAVVVPNGSGSALSRITTTTRVIAIKIPNIAGVRSSPWQNYITTAAQIQADTGYTFFSELSSTVATALRAKVDGAASVGSPTVTTQPSTQSAAVGGNASFTVVAAGDATLTYQWSRDEVELSGATATTATLTLTNLNATDAGNYSVVIKNSVGSITSAAVPLVITGLPPVVVTPPAARTVSAGTSATFAVVTSGSPTLTYQWRKAGVAIAGNATATTATLTLANAQAADVASYDVVVSNSVGSVTSTAALLAVTPAAPSIATAPTAQTVTPGGTATLSVIASGSGPFTYQWRKAGVAVTGNTSATTATLTLPSATAADSASYDVVITNSLGTVTSTAIALSVTVTPPPAVQWDFVAAEPKSGLPADVTGGTVVQRNNNGTTLTLTTVSVSSGYTGFSGTSNAGAAARVGALNLAEGGSAFFEFTFTPSTGRQLSVTGMSFGARSTSTGPQAYALFAVNGSGDAALVASGPLANNSVWTLITPTFLPVVSAAAAPVTFRLYGFNGAGNAGTSTANWRIDDLSVNLATGTGLALGDPAAQRLANLSSRVRVTSDVAIAGFVIAGTASKPVLIRAAGPTLGALGVAGTLTAPKLDLYRGSAVIATNTGWTTATNSPAIASAAASSGAFAFGAGSADSAILTTLAPGAYTAFIGAGAGAAGVGLIEIYDLSAPTPGQNLLNLSTRAIAGTGTDTLISGLVIGGTLPKRVLIRAAGPALAQFGLTGLLTRPQLTLFSGATPVLVNAGWTTSPDAAAIPSAAASVGAFAFAPGSADAAMIVTLAPGAYTAQVTGVAETTGLALLEVYELP